MQTAGFRFTLGITWINQVVNTLGHSPSYLIYHR